MTAKKRNVGNGIGIGAALGVAFGVAYGYKSGNFSQSIALGLTIGVAFGAIFDFGIKKSNSKVKQQRTANSRFAKTGVSCFYDSEVLNPSSVLIMKFSVEKQCLCKVANR